jgi:hypothetical protein
MHPLLHLESKSQLICRENRRRPHQTFGIENPLSSILLLVVLFDNMIGQNNVVFSLLDIVSTESLKRGVIRRISTFQGVSVCSLLSRQLCMETLLYHHS